MKSYFRIAIFSLLLILASTSVFADGMILPIEPDPDYKIRPRPVYDIIFIPPPRPTESFTVPLSVTSHKVNVEISDFAAATNVDQKFYNHENRTIEGLYIFPLPISASISGFAMDVDGKMTKGELLDAGKAKKIYEDIVRQMKDPGLLEYMGSGLFKTRIYPINARSEKRVKLAYQESLKLQGNLVRYVYPLRIDRYAKEPMKDVSIEVKIKSKTPITSVYSPTHKISVHRNGDNEATVGFESNSLVPDKDFILYYGVSKKDMSVSLLTHRPDPTEDGSFMLMIAPRVKSQEEKNPKIDVCLVMDTSGSMAGKKIDQAKNALKFCINSLKEGSNFYLANFSTEAESYKDKMIPINQDTRDGAINYINNLDAMGGTNISEALEQSLKAAQNSNSGNPSFIVFVTDGKPTAGETEVGEILKIVSKKNTDHTRLFTFGVGDNLNAQLIDELAVQNGGTSDYVAEDEDMEIKVSSLFSKLTHPVMTKVEVEFNNIEVSQVYPRKINDIFKDSNLMILGRYKSPGEARITLKGLLKDESVKLDYEMSFPRSSSENAFVSRIWATRKIGFLLEQIRKNGEDSELKDEIVKLAKKYGILTPYTSFLVLEDNKNLGPNLRDSMLQDSPSQVRLEETKSRYSLKKLSSDFEGVDAVGASREMNSMKSAGFPNSAPVYKRSTPSVLKQIDKMEVEGKTFYLINNCWVDSAIQNEDKETEIEAFSEEYFELIQKSPEIGKYLSLGKNVKVLHNGRVLKIVSN